jgi:hypothetical protein
MIIVIAGMQRSGSTFSFNVAREVLEARGSVTVVSTNSLEEAIDAGRNTDHLIIKTHAPDEQINDLIVRKECKCICTYRKPEDAVVSWMNVFSFSLEESVAIITEWLEWHTKMRQHLFNETYENIDNRPLFAVYTIGKELVRDLSFIETCSIWWKYRKQKVKKMTEKFSEADETAKNIGFSYYNTTNFFHRRHISSIKNISADRHLTPEQLRYVRDSLCMFTDINGNYRWSQVA